MRQILFIILILSITFTLISQIQDSITVDSTLTMTKAEVLSLRNAVTQDQSNTNPYYYYFRNYIGEDTIPVPQPFSGGNRVLKAKWKVHELSYNVLQHSLMCIIDSSKQYNSYRNEINPYFRDYATDYDITMYDGYFNLPTGTIINIQGTDTTRVDGPGFKTFVLGDLLKNYSVTYDMMYYYMIENGHQTQLQHIRHLIEELALFAKNSVLTLSREHHPYGAKYADTSLNNKYPSGLFHNYRLKLLAALGMAGVILGDSLGQSITDYVDWELFEFDPFINGTSNPQQNSHPGYFGLRVGNSGAYTEGPGYSAFAMTDMVDYFYLRRKVDAVDHFSKSYVRQIFEAMPLFITPAFSINPLDDTHVAYHGDFRNPNFIEGMAEYFHIDHPQADQEVLELIKWYFNAYNYRYKNFSSTSSDWPYWTADEKKSTFFRTFNPSSSLYDNNFSLNSIPAILQRGTYTDGELTILRPKIGSYSDMLKPQMYIHHENSYSPMYHEDSDQNSFQLFYKQKQLLIDPGYHPGSWYVAREWLMSPFAHNLIMVNPNLTAENNELQADFQDIIGLPFADWKAHMDSYAFYPDQLYEPVGADKYVLYGSNNTFPMHVEKYNPSFKELYVSNEKSSGSKPIEHLQTKITYDHRQKNNNGDLTYDSQKIDDIIDIKRDFYSIDDRYFIIVDDVESSDHTIENAFMNQLHFAIYDSLSIDNVNLDTSGIFIHSNNFHEDGDAANQTYLYGAMGCLGSGSYYEIKDSLPQGAYQGNIGRYYMHKSLRMFSVTQSDERFMTILIPGCNFASSHPVTEAYNSSGFYGTRILLNGGPSSRFDWTIYTGMCSESTSLRSFTFSDTGNVTTDGSMFHLPYAKNNNIFGFNIILNSGSYLSYTPKDSSEIVLFESDSTVFELLGSYYEENNEDKLDLSLYMESPFEIPRFRIKRNGVAPEYFSHNLYSLAQPQPGGERGVSAAVFKSIAYDDDYFYVNYEIDELPDNNDIVLYKGDFAGGRIEDSVTVYIDTDTENLFFTGNLDVRGTLIIESGSDKVYFSNGADLLSIPGSQIEIKPGARLSFGSLSGVNVRGAFIAHGTETDMITFTSADAPTKWNGISFRDNNFKDIQYCHMEFANNGFYFDNCAIDTFSYNLIENCPTGFYAYQDPPSDVRINYNIFRNCEIGIRCRTFGYGNQPITVTYVIENDSVRNCEVGIMLEDCLGEPIIRDVYIRGCSSGIRADDSDGVNIIGFSTGTTPVEVVCIEDNDMGIYCYNSDLNIDNVYLKDSRTYGLACYNGAHPELDESFIINSVSSNIYCASAHPVMADGHNDIIQEGYGDLAYCRKPPSGTTIDCSGNWWGDLKPNSLKFMPSGTQYFDYLPADQDTNWTWGRDTGGESEAWELYNGALENEEYGYYTSAQGAYKYIISEYQDSEPALISLKRVLICEEQKDSGQDFAGLKSYFTSLLSGNEDDTTFYMFSRNLSVICERKMHNYDEALLMYNEIMDEPLDEVDSIFTMVNIMLTHMEIEDFEGRISLDGMPVRVMNLKPLNSKDYLSKSTELLKELMPFQHRYKLESIVRNYSLTCYPNPFNPTTTIQFSLKEDCKTSLKVYNIRGQLVKTLVDEDLDTGVYNVIWDGKNSNSESVSSGIYFSILEADGKLRETKKMILMK